jgi:hypothetical protein
VPADQPLGEISPASGEISPPSLGELSLSYDSVEHTLLE